MRQKQLPKQNRPAGSRLSKTDERQRSFVVRSGKHRGASAVWPPKEPRWWFQKLKHVVRDLAACDSQKMAKDGFKYSDFKEPGANSWVAPSTHFFFRNFFGGLRHLYKRPPPLDPNTKNVYGGPAAGPIFCFEAKNRLEKHTWHNPFWVLVFFWSCHLSQKNCWNAGKTAVLNPPKSVNQEA